jgi:hypothetical protein
MKKLNILLLSGILCLATACEKVIGDGPVMTERRNLSNYNGVDLRCAADVSFEQAPEFKLEVSAQQNILDILITELQNNKLVVRFKNDKRVKKHEPIIVKVTGPDLNSLRISGSGNIQTLNDITTQGLDLDVSGSGNIRMGSLTATAIDANISGSGNIGINSGATQSQRLKISGSGNINLLGVPAKSVSTTTSGSGEMRVFASEMLNVTISGSGSVYYFGAPSVNASISGSGAVRKL